MLAESTAQACRAPLLASFLVWRSFFEAQGSPGTNPPPRPPTIPGLNLGGQEGTGGEGARRVGVDNEGRGRQGVIPPSMYTRVDADSARLRPPQGSTKSANSNRNNNDGVSPAAGDGGLAIGGNSPSSSFSSSTWQNNPGTFAGASNGYSGGRVSSGHHQTVSAARQRALSAAGRSAGGLRPVLFNHRAGGGGGGVGGSPGDQDPGYYQYEGGHDGGELR